MDNKKPKASRHKIIVSIIIGLFLFIGILLVCGWLIINRILGSPHVTPDVPQPLGDSSKLEYIGRKDYGCHGFCDSGPSTIYYYATDMTAEEVAMYFKKAKLDNLEDVQTSNPSTPVTLFLTLSSGTSFPITYYTNGEEYLKDTYMHTKATGKHVIDLLAEHYQTARSAL